jgi:hypothetical protein
MKRVCAGSWIGGAVVVACLVLAPAAMAATLKVCVPGRGNAPMLTPSHGKCRHGYRLTSLGGEGKPGPAGKTGPEGKPGATGPEGKSSLSSGELETLKAILPFVKFVSSGVAGKPTVQFSGVNVQVVNGSGKTETTNGAGNVIIGYDETEPADKQTGSHDLIVGNLQSFTSFGGILGGEANTISGPFASVTGGFGNEAKGRNSAVSGGEINTAEGEGGAVSGGELNKAIGIDSSVSGGFFNFATNNQSWVGGGEENQASGERSSVSGGAEDIASGKWASVSGGGGNTASGKGSSVTGEQNKKATKEFEWLP